MRWPKMLQQYKEDTLLGYQMLSNASNFPSINDGSVHSMMYDTGMNNDNT